jgi:hypothetical protein
VPVNPSRGPAVAAIASIMKGVNAMTSLTDTTERKRPSRLLAIATLAAIGLSLALWSAPPPAEAGPPPHAKAFGLLSRDWWQWVLSIPAEDNPLLDETGAKVALNQSGDVWYLAGVLSASGEAVRTATIPSGKWLFFPVLNYEFDNYLCLEPDLTLSIGQMRKAAGDVMDTAVDLLVEVDGVPHAYKRATSPPFAITLPEDNVFLHVGCPDAPAAGTYAPAISDGYWVMLEPLPVGEHTIHFRGTLPDIPFTLDITYHLTVAP